MDNLFVKTTIDFLHILATIAWIGGMFINIFILRPSAIKTLAPADAGKLTRTGMISSGYRFMVQ